MTETVLLHIGEAIALGVIVAVLLRLFRTVTPVRRIGGSLMLIAVLLGLDLIITGSGWPGEDSLTRIIGSVAIMAAVNAMLQVLDVVLWRGILMRGRQVAVPRLLIDLFHLAVLLIVAVIVLNTVFKVDLSALLVTSTVVSAVIGLALQDMLSNVIAGLAMQIEQPFGVGDWVLANGYEGRVAQLNWRTLTLLTRDNHHVILPNSNVAKREIANYSRPEPLQRAHVLINVGYQHPPGEVKPVLMAAARDVPGVCMTPEPEVIVADFAESAVTYDVRYWITDYARFHNIRDEVLTRIWYAFKRSGVTIPFPTREIKVHTVTDHETRSLEQQHRDVFSVLRPLSLFASLDDNQVHELAAAAESHLYVAGEDLFKQGDAGGSLFVVRSGAVRLTKHNEAGQDIPVGELGAGEFFGEMSLLTGEPRLVTVTANLDTEVVVVHKAELAALLTHNAEIVEALSVALVARAKQTADRVALANEQRPNQSAPQSTALRDRMRSFFGLN